MAQLFDAERFKAVGNPFPIADDIATRYGGVLGMFSLSSVGSLAYRAGANTGVGYRLQWMDRVGNSLGTIGVSGDYTDVELSTDGKRVAVVLVDAQATAADIWLLDSALGLPTRVTTSPGVDTTPAWSPDGQFLAYSSDRGGTYGDLNGYIKTLATVSPDRLVAKGARMRDWSQDGKVLLFDTRQQTGVFQMSYMSLEREQKPVPLPGHGGNEAQGQFATAAGGGSPRWIAYTSNATGDNEVYVESFPSGTNSVRISTDGGYGPRWRSDGKELFYLSRENAMMAVDVTLGASFEHGAPHELFKTRARGGGPQAYSAQYDVSPDGQKFLIINRPGDAAASAPITVVLNWLAGVKK